MASAEFSSSSRRKRKTFQAAATVTAVATALALSGCGSSGSSSKSLTPSNSGTSGANSTTTVTLGKTGGTTAPGNATSGSITFWASSITSGTPDPRVVLIDDFEKAYPNIHVKLENAPASTTTNQQTLSTQIGGGSGPDVYMGDVIWPADFGEHQFAVPLSKYLPSSYWNTFASGLVSGASYKGQVYAAPFFTDEGLLYYRKDILKKDHLAVPTTWEQLVTESKQIQAKKQTTYGYVFQGADYEGATCDFMEFLADAGGSVLNSAGTKSTLTSNGGALKALTFMDSLVKDGISPKAENTYEESNSISDFDAGDSAFLRYWTSGYASSQASGSSVIGKVGVAPLPTFSGSSQPGYGNIGGWNLYVNPHSKNIAADLTFVKWMTGTTAQTILATKFALVPTTTAVRSAPDITKINPVYAVLSKTRLIARPSGSPNYTAISTALYQNISAMLAGQKSPSQALSSMDSGVNSAASGAAL
jgi:multiple sugar transport system substrate-binding protein